MAVNLASRRVMEKAGLAYVRTFHLEWENPLPGAEYGEVEYALTKEDWEQREAAGRGKLSGSAEPVEQDGAEASRRVSPSE